ncbi:MAG: TIGR03546 family protein [Desulfosarcina sp.]|nr:TIGR03546 family protein [Desulfosarcina sp.]MBC2743615.1 TIGR03546 family protein [Desulfosarcina sp.]MBC2766524.1 TIGR03546 family protein [Desulfosarcina sp.]
MIEAIANLLKALNSETEPGQISLALCLSMIAGFTPMLSLHNLLVLLLVLVLRVNLSAFGLGWVFFSAAAYLLDPLFHRVGLAVLTSPTLTGLWTGLYNTTWFRLDRLNNTIVMGSLLFSLVSFVPGFILFNLLIRRYRVHILAWVKRTRLMRAFEATKFYEVYQSMSGWTGGAV